MPDDQVPWRLTTAADFLSRSYARANGGEYRDWSRKMATLIAICAIVGACTPPSTDTAPGQLHEFDLICPVHWTRENPSPWQPADLPEQHYHIDLSKDLVNYSVPLSANPIQLSWTSVHEGYMYRITINRVTGALYEMQLFLSGLRTGYDISGTCEPAPPPPPLPKF